MGGRWMFTWIILKFWIIFCINLTVVNYCELCLQGGGRAEMQAQLDSQLSNPFRISIIFCRHMLWNWLELNPNTVLKKLDNLISSNILLLLETYIFLRKKFRYVWGMPWINQRVPWAQLISCLEGIGRD